MRANFKDMTGQTFGYWNVIERAPNDKDGNACWKCRCVCGTERIILGHALRRGQTKSCGCMSSKMHTESSTKHGGCVTNGDIETKKLYAVWRAMRQRCSSPSVKAYKNYGGRGIRVCEEWDESFEAFRDWSKQNGYKVGLTIDRIDVNGNYEPQNCRWVSRAVQSNNTRRTRRITYNGEMHSLYEWAQITGLNYNTLIGRIYHYGWPVSEALETGVWEGYHYGLTKKEA